MQFLYVNMKIIQLFSFDVCCSKHCITSSKKKTVHTHNTRNVTEVKGKLIDTRTQKKLGMKISNTAMKNNLPVQI